MDTPNNDFGTRYVASRVFKQIRKEPTANKKYNKKSGSKCYGKAYS